MALTFNNFDDVFKHMQQVCAAFNYKLEIKPIIEEKKEAVSLGELKSGGTK